MRIHASLVVIAVITVVAVAAAFGPELMKRTRSAQDLCVRWCETRSALELEIYPQVVAIARRVIAEAFSNQVVTPGVTTTEELRWWIRKRFAALDLPIQTPS